MNKRKPLTEKQHEELGYALWLMRAQLQHTHVVLENDHYPINSKPTLACQRAEKALDAFRSAMDDLFYAETDSQGPSPYYSEARERFEKAHGSCETSEALNLIVRSK
jgi:hypothetical protein